MSNSQENKLTAEILAFCKGLGADLVAVASVERFGGAPDGHKPQDILPGARSVISFALNALEGTFLPPTIHTYQLSYSLLRHTSNGMSYQIAKFLENKGFYSVMIPATFPLDMVEKKGLFGDFSHRHAAVAAGLGELGRISILVTPQYGPRVWLGTVITTAPLEASHLLDGPVCPRDTCSLCIEACPTGALGPNGIDVKECLKSGVHSWNLSGLLRHIKKILREPDALEKEKIATGPDTWQLYQSMVCGLIPHCDKCLAACPIGRHCR